MPVLFRPAASGAVYLKGRAMKLGNAMLGSPNGSGIKYQLVDGYLMKAVRSAGTVIVYVLDLPVLFCIADWYTFAQTGITPYWALPVPGAREFFYRRTDTIDLVVDPEPMPRRVGSYISYGPKVGSITTGNQVKARGLFTSSDDGVVCVRTERRDPASDTDKDVITVQRASASIWWFPDDVTPEEINDTVAGKQITLNRVSYIDFPKVSMDFWLGPRQFTGYANICIENSVYERRADDAMVCAHTFFDWTGVDKCAGVLVWRYRTFYVDNQPPAVEPYWGTQVDLTMLPDSLLKPTRATDGHQLDNAILTTLPAYTETRGMVAMYAEALHQVGPNYYTGRGLAVLDVNVGNGTMTARIVDEHTFASETFVYLYTQVLGMQIQVSTEPEVWEPRIVSTRTKWNQFVDDLGFPTDVGVYPHADDLDIVIVSPNGTMLEVDIPGYWPRAHILSLAADEDGGYPIGTYTHLNSSIPDSDVGEAYYAQPVCQYADDLIAVVCSPDAAFGVSAVPVSIALVRISTGQVMEVRPTGFTGYMYHNFGITCPKRAVGSFVDGVWVESLPGTLLMDVRRFDGPFGAPPPYPQTDNGMWVSNTGGTAFTHAFGYRGILAYYLGSQFVDHPMRSADPTNSI